MSYRNTYAAWAEAFTIFAKYDKRPESFGDVSAEHDVIYAGPNPADVSEEDNARLEELGWHIDEGCGCYHRYP